MSRRAFVTGGAGFIGSALCLELVEAGVPVTCFDRLSYAAAPQTVSALTAAGVDFVKGDIRDRAALGDALNACRPDMVFHLAAETHVDRSIDAASVFVDTNVTGTLNVLESLRALRDAYGRDREQAPRLIHVSTDEVFGALSATDAPFTETTPYDPSSPYSASKAASDHLVRAWARTYGLDVCVSNCSNNYGPRQFPEKLIPLMILNAAEGKRLPIYGNGTNRRDWLHVEDHVRALHLIAARGASGRTYCIGGGAERSNLEVVETLCAILDERRPASAPHSRLIDFVADRPGHDWRYAIDASRAGAELGWAPRENFEDGLAATLDWYLANPQWLAPLLKQYGRERLGQA
ncbi:MAG: dTDP-glucose 4,6-dehydratase [Oceanicaulis sp.]